MADPIAAWWWKYRSNFGDALTPFVMRYVSGREIKWVDCMKADIYGIGSVLNTVRERVLKKQTPAYVWGSGMMEPVSADFLDLAAVACLRGPLSATLLGMDDVAQGDPGLLANEVFGFDTGGKKTHRFGIVPHFSHLALPEIKALSDGLSSVTVIDPLNPDIYEVTRQIAACEVILSSSLHGLVVADSLLVPNFWIGSGRINKRSRFKFYDYAMSVNRNMKKPFGVAEILADPEAFSTGDIPYSNDIDRAKDAVRGSFPRELMS